MKKNQTTPKRDELIRLNKFLADAGVASRRKADELIETGKVKVNGKRVTELGMKVEPGAFVTVNGNPVGNPEKSVYILLNKPKDYITSTSDEEGRKTVMDIVRKEERIYPVGRLDRNTTGVLLLMNDGELANRLMHPKYQVEKTYAVKLDKPLHPENAERLVTQGIELEDGIAKPYKILIDPENPTKLLITIFEGRNREVRRIFEHFGLVVKQLDRRTFAGIPHSGMLRGKYRHLKIAEVRALRKLVGLKENKLVR